MRLIRRSLASLLLTSAVAVSVVTTGCAEHRRVYDAYYSDYHTWDGREDAAYRHWLSERHYEYREYNKLDKDPAKRVLGLAALSSGQITPSQQKRYSLAFSMLARNCLTAEGCAACAPSPVRHDR